MKIEHKVSSETAVEYFFRAVQQQSSLTLIFSKIYLCISLKQINFLVPTRVVIFAKSISFLKRCIFFINYIFCIISKE